MASLLRSFLPLIRAEVKNQYTYKVWLWIGLLNATIQTLFFYYFWKYVNGNADIQLLSYVVVARITYLIVGSGSLMQIGNEIYTGNISIHLARPTPFPLVFFYRYIGRQLAQIAVQGILPFLLFYFVLGLSVQNDQVPFFLISISFSWMLLYLVDFLFSFICFITNNMWGVSAFREGLLQILSGTIVPLSLFPGWLSTLNNYLPFKYIIDTPIKILIYDGNVISSLGMQLAWIAIVYAVTSILWIFVQRRLSVQGG